MAELATVEKVVTLEEVKKNEEVRLLIEMADRYMGVIGYTEHGLRHTALVANIAHNVMSRLRQRSRPVDHRRRRRLSGKAGQTARKRGKKTRMSARPKESGLSLNL